MICENCRYPYFVYKKQKSNIDLLLKTFFLPSPHNCHRTPKLAVIPYVSDDRGVDGYI